MFKKKLRAFTLTELLVVMAILGFLMTLSVAGIQFALRRSRDVQRQNIVVSLENGLNAYYASNQNYPEETCSGGGPSGWKLCTYDKINEMVTGSGSIANYVQGNWSWGPVSAADGNSVGYYYDDSSGTALSFAVCILTEDKGSTETNQRGRYNGCFCKGPGSNTFTAGTPTNRCQGLGTN